MNNIHNNLDKKEKQQEQKKEVIKDPFAQREAEKYPNPIPSREYILDVFQKYGVPLNFNQLKKELKIHDQVQKIALKRRLKAMVRDGQLIKINNNKNYCIKEFVDKYNVNNDSLDPLLDAGGITDLDNLVVEIPTRTMVGKLFQINSFNYVVPFFNKENKEFNQDVLIPAGKEGGAVVGDLVVIEVFKPVFKWADPIGKIVKIIGKDGNLEAIISAAIIALDIPHKWSDYVTHELAQTSTTIDAETIRSRIDLRDLSFVTIDGEDTKDFDDAVYCRVNSHGGWKLYVAIADVSYYVKQGSILDQEAMLRGNSIYFPSKVIPMLPELFSNDLCSLKPNIDRLTLVCEVDISSDGKLIEYKFYEAIINSKARLTYNQVDKILNTLGKENVTNDNRFKHLGQAITSNLKNLYMLFLVLHQQREVRGTIEFNINESKVVFNTKGQTIAVKPIKRNIAHKIIEECMLCANVATAKLLEKNDITSIYRVHEGPKAVKLMDLQAFLAGVGLTLNFTEDSKPISKDYAKLLQSISDRKDYDVIQMILLRSMCQAIYSTDNIGHFGLAYPTYTHFTSPIRRYADLLVHRHIKAILTNSTDSLSLSVDQVAHIADHCSMTERRADEVTREIIRACKCHYLTNYVGNKFSGVVSGVTKFGLFVEIKDVYIDGLLHVNSLGNDYFIHDPVHHKLIVERSGIIYSLGMELEVIISKVDLDRRRVDFILTKQHSTKKVGNKKAVSSNIKAKHKIRGKITNKCVDKVKLKSRSKSKLKGSLKTEYNSKVELTNKSKLQSKKKISSKSKRNKLKSNELKTNKSNLNQLSSNKFKHSKKTFKITSNKK